MNGSKAIYTNPYLGIAIDTKLTWEEIMLVIEDASKKYREKTGHPPNSCLIGTEIMPKVPKGTDGIILSTNTVVEFEDTNPAEALGIEEDTAFKGHLIYLGVK